ncbi:proline-rich receptor-like protein kinase PERK9 [Iris pallida]|uniref:Proline-rich receptor-like protein kinase PERK9 n=1 Tax=Iris pallida TaxID=29817 RepID=A0AAX6HJ61_IRIPA|nr:proline-rich receptor-like protein kinase PERK9 [Iris pallida]
MEAADRQSVRSRRGRPVLWHWEAAAEVAGDKSAGRRSRRTAQGSDGVRDEGLAARWRVMSWTACGGCRAAVASPDSAAVRLRKGAIVVVVGETGGGVGDAGRGGAVERGAARRRKSL